MSTRDVVIVAGWAALVGGLIYWLGIGPGVAAAGLVTLALGFFGIKERP